MHYHTKLTLDFILSISFFRDGVIKNKPALHDIPEDDLELVILLPLPSECWHYRANPPPLIYARTLYMLDKHYLHPNPNFSF